MTFVLQSHRTTIIFKKKKLIWLTLILSHTNKSIPPKVFPVELNGPFKHEFAKAQTSIHPPICTSQKSSLI